MVASSKSSHVLLPARSLANFKEAGPLWRKAWSRVEEVLGEAELQDLCYALSEIRPETIVEA